MCTKIFDVFLGVDILYFYVTIRDEPPEVVVLGSDVLRTRSYFLLNRNRDRPLIVFVKCYRRYWFLVKTAQYR